MLILSKGGVIMSNPIHITELQQLLEEGTISQEEYEIALEEENVIYD